MKNCERRVRYPIGYVQQEADYCEQEYLLFEKSDSDGHREQYRKYVLDKREEFRIKWNKENREIVLNVQIEGLADSNPNKGDAP